VLGTIAVAVAVFAGTDVDDLIVLTVLFLAGRATGRPRARDIVTGQYLGIAALVAASVAAALGLLVIPDRWVGLLGLVPLALGIRGLVAARRHTEKDETPVATGVLSIAALTIANGADNISVYVPLFRGIGPGAGALTIGTFAVMVAVWLALAYWLGSHRRIVAVVERFGHWLVPVVFIVIGLVLLARPIGIFASFA
jgi:cadmium resistance protein CadD (predicted permease)